MTYTVVCRWERRKGRMYLIVFKVDTEPKKNNNAHTVNPSSHNYYQYLIALISILLEKWGEKKTTKQKQPNKNNKKPTTSSLSLMIQ